MMYTRRGAGLYTDWNQAVRPNDFAWLEVNGVELLAYYRTPHTGHVLDCPTVLIPAVKFIAAEDANTSHPDWDPGDQSERGGGGLRNGP